MNEDGSLSVSDGVATNLLKAEISDGDSFIKTIFREETVISLHHPSQHVIRGVRSSVNL